MPLCATCGHAAQVAPLGGTAHRSRRVQNGLVFEQSSGAASLHRHSQHRRIHLSRVEKQLKATPLATHSAGLQPFTPEICMRRCTVCWQRLLLMSQDRLAGAGAPQTARAQHRESTKAARRGRPAHLQYFMDQDGRTHELLPGALAHLQQRVGGDEHAPVKAEARRELRGREGVEWSCWVLHSMPAMAGPHCRGHERRCKCGISHRCVNRPYKPKSHAATTEAMCTWP